MTTPKKTSGKGKKPSEKSATAASDGKRSAVSAYGNTWDDVNAATAADVKAVETQLGVSLPIGLAELLMTCGGGRPTRNFFDGPANEAFELGIGHLLPLRDQPKKRGVASVCISYRTSQAMPAELTPFAYDTGNANPICLRMPKRDIVYWLHDEPDERIRRVAPSLGEFLAGLGECPF